MEKISTRINHEAKSGHVDIPRTSLKVGMGFSGAAILCEILRRQEREANGTRSRAEIKDAEIRFSVPLGALARFGHVADLVPVCYFKLYTHWHLETMSVSTAPIVVVHDLVRCCAIWLACTCDMFTWGFIARPLMAECRRIRGLRTAPSRFFHCPC